jgi:hypothetical protein
MIRDIKFSELESLLRRTPVLAEVHSLVPLGLSGGTRVMDNSAELLAILDSPEPHDESNLLVLGTKSPLSNRFPIIRCHDLPSLELLNERLPHNLSYARQRLLRTTGVAEYITRELAQQAADVVVFYLVDGLSYWDVRDWPFDARPCFVDGPSVTYQLTAESSRQVRGDIGFPGIIGRPSLAERLYPLGYRQARGYSYWNRDNAVADYMFRGIHLVRAESFEMMAARLRKEPLQPSTFIQIVQEGLDGLAHHRRELRRAEITAAIDKILTDVLMLVEFFQANGLSVVVYLTADHGILWRTEHEFRSLAYMGERRPRYARVTTTQEPPTHSTRFNLGDAQYDLFHYPYLGKDIKSNDSGVHGGLSVQESIVPLVTIRG